jgi:hypothetical protein
VRPPQTRWLGLDRVEWAGIGIVVAVGGLFLLLYVIVLLATPSGGANRPLRAEYLGYRRVHETDFFGRPLPSQRVRLYFRVTNTSPNRYAMWYQKYAESHLKDEFGNWYSLVQATPDRRMDPGETRLVRISFEKHVAQARHLTVHLYSHPLTNAGRTLQIHLPKGELAREPSED